jgi:S-phase kinase-associated protein 1
MNVANMSELVKTMMDEDADEDDGPTEIPLPNVKAQVLRKVIEFCEHHLQEPMTEIEKPLKSQNMADVVQKWYADFVDLEQVLLFELILAANYMDIKPLLDLTCATVASMIKGKTVSRVQPGESRILRVCECLRVSRVFANHSFHCFLPHSPRKSVRPSILPMTFRQKKKLKYERRTSGVRRPKFSHMKSITV